jgi:hypothetical protein
MKQFTPEQKHEILLEYTPHSHTHGAAALAARHAVAGGVRTVQRWLARWNGTAASLRRKEGSRGHTILTHAEVQRHIATPIRRANRSARQVKYTKVAERVREATGKSVSDRTVQRIGKEELGGRRTRGKKRTAEESECTHTMESEDCCMCVAGVLIKVDSRCVHFSVSASMCDEIASIRRKFQRIGTAHILVLDETHKRVGDVDNYTIVLPGEPPYIETEETSKYAAKYDMIACCSGERVLPPMIYSPSERGTGITTAMLLQYVRDLLAQAAGALDVYPLYLLLDRSTIHNETQLLQEFHDWGCQDLVKSSGCQLQQPRD